MMNTAIPSLLPKAYSRLWPKIIKWKRKKTCTYLNFSAEDMHGLHPWKHCMSLTFAWNFNSSQTSLVHLLLFGNFGSFHPRSQKFHKYSHVTFSVSLFQEILQSEPWEFSMFIYYDWAPVFKRSHWLCGIDHKTRRKKLKTTIFIINQCNLQKRSESGILSYLIASHPSKLSCGIQQSIKICWSGLKIYLQKQNMA